MYSRVALCLSIRYPTLAPWARSPKGANMSGKWAWYAPRAKAARVTYMQHRPSSETSLLAEIKWGSIVNMLVHHDDYKVWDYIASHA